MSRGSNNQAVINLASYSTSGSLRIVQRKKCIFIDMMLSKMLDNFVKIKYHQY